MNNNKLCVVFDIDETLIHFMPNNFMTEWSNLTPEKQNKIKKNIKTIELNDGILFFRPNLKKLFDFFKETPFIKPALWTFGTRDYGNFIKKILINEFNLSSDFFLFMWGVEDMDDNNIPKDLNKIYNTFKEYNETNTFIVDNLYTNLTHTSNINNSILIEEFSPIKINSNTHDICLNKLVRICKRIIKVNHHNTPASVSRLYNGPIFSKENLEKLKLYDYLTYTIKKLPTITNIATHSKTIKKPTTKKTKRITKLTRKK